VLVPDIYDPTLNPLYRDVLAHYGAVAMPCRIQDPDRKGKVESGVGHTQKTPLKVGGDDLRDGRFFRAKAQAYLGLNSTSAPFADSVALHASLCSITCNPKTNPENPSTKGKAKATSKPAKEV
jgi:hypothetical protein